MTRKEWILENQPQITIGYDLQRESYYWENIDDDTYRKGFETLDDTIDDIFYYYNN